MGIKWHAHCIFHLLFFILNFQTNNAAVKRSIDMSAAYSLNTDDRLPKSVLPISYEIHLEPNYEECTFSGLIKIKLSWAADSKKISLHAHHDLNINDRKIKMHKINQKYGDENSTDYVAVLRGSRIPKKNIYVVYLKETIMQGTECTLEIPFDGNIWSSAEGFFTGSYENTTYFATNLRLNNAHRLFPCFDEPGFKVPFIFSITRPKELVALFNTPLNQSTEHPKLNEYVIDFFEKTPPMSTFTFGFFISALQLYKSTNIMTSSQPIIQMWTLKDDENQLEETYIKIVTIYNKIKHYFGTHIPLSKIDVVCIPDLPLARPVDNWGLLLFGKRDLLRKGHYDITHELIYQWLGSWVTPNWWNDAHLNKAIASFLASDIVLEIDGGVEFNGKYPMTTLYSLYYEFSKRYPHSRITGMKQETISHKTELVLRMLNFTLSKKSFQNGIRNFILEYQYKTFCGDDFWESLNSQSLKDGTLKPHLNVGVIVNTWFAYHRLPVVKVLRDYTEKTAILQQKVYLRERPHDVPEQEKMLWWIPILLNRQDALNFSSGCPYLWMENKKQINIQNMPEKDQFIIINYEEIAPFPVNYDNKNWKMLSDILQTDNGRKQIPPYTRAKLLHDAWNLAFAGDLSFSAALNMTLFIKYERNHIVWNPVFTFIDQIGRHIDESEVHAKFESYVIFLLAPFYEELGEELSIEDNWKTDIRTLTKRFLCRAGYKPCIKEAEQTFEIWQNTTNPNHEYPEASHYLCPIFKWGSLEKWQFGLERVMQFPKSRKLSERTHLLKALAGCPTQPEKIEQLLKITILEDHSNFTENDKFLILTSLTSGSSHYSLLNFVSTNWMTLRQKFKNKTNLWDHLIGSATGFFLNSERL
ncbi:aminopeptidase N [Drosophila sulfurigaster albostrigata]|uniref:aminopeptidase N n=1 Tax=Drosophila sulfurigaster albostrigata TaxID=89887 RepID=UPI002D21DDE6|nr:aminopeptidase N [Drosophila sulfurigaster albostrigata]